MPATATLEAIDVRRIRLAQATGTTAVVSEFRTADQVLARWTAREGGAKTPRRVVRQFTFEITFTDGYTFCGCYEFRRGSSNGTRRRPSLTHFVRTIFSAMAAPQQDAGAVDLSRYAIDTN